MGPGNPPAVRLGLIQDPAKYPICFVLAGLLPGPLIQSRFLRRVVPGLRFHLEVPATFPSIKCLRSQRTMTGWISRMCSFTRSSTSHFQICHRINIHSIAVKWHQMISRIYGWLIATERILVRSQIGQREVKERLKLHNVRPNHVLVWSELKYLIGAKIVNLKCRDFGDKTGLFPTVRVFHVVRPVAPVRTREEPDAELTRKFWPVANTISAIDWRCRCYVGAST